MSLLDLGFVCDIFTMGKRGQMKRNKGKSKSPAKDS